MTNSRAALISTAEARTIPPPELSSFAAEVNTARKVGTATFLTASSVPATMRPARRTVRGPLAVAQLDLPLGGSTGRTAVVVARTLVRLSPIGISVAHGLFGPSCSWRPCPSSSPPRSTATSSSSGWRSGIGPGLGNSMLWPALAEQCPRRGSRWSDYGASRGDAESSQRQHANPEQLEHLYELAVKLSGVLSSTAVNQGNFLWP